MKAIDPHPQTVCPLPSLRVKKESYFQFFSLTFATIETLTFFSTFTSLITSKQHIFLVLLVLRLSLLTAMAKVLLDYIKSDAFGTAFAYYYSMVRVVTVSGIMVFLGAKSMVSGIFQTVFFPARARRRHAFHNVLVGVGMFVVCAGYCVYLNYLFYEVIRRKRAEGVEGDASDKAHLSEAKSGITEP